MTTTLKRQDWRELALCHASKSPVNWWLSEDPDHQHIARIYCDRCPVKSACDEAGRREPVGIWAGLDPKERRDALGGKLAPWPVNCSWCGAEMAGARHNRRYCYSCVAKAERYRSVVAADQRRAETNRCIYCHAEMATSKCHVCGRKRRPKGRR